MKELFLFSKIKKQKSTGDLLSRGANKPKRENYVRNVLLIIEIEEAELASTLSLFKEYFDSRTILKATSDGLIYYVGIPSTDKGFFLKKLIADEDVTCPTFTLGFVYDLDQNIDKYVSLSETNGKGDLIIRKMRLENLSYYLNDEIPPPEIRFSLDEIPRGGRRQSVLEVFEGPEKDKDEDSEEEQAKRPVPGELKKRRSLPNLLA